MFDNPIADQAYNLYHGKTVKIRGENMLGEFDSRFDGFAVAKVYKAWYGKFGGLQYYIYCSPPEDECRDKNEHYDIYTAPTRIYRHAVNTYDDLKEIEKHLIICDEE